MVTITHGSIHVCPDNPFEKTPCRMSSKQKTFHDYLIHPESAGFLDDRTLSYSRRGCCRRWIPWTMRFARTIHLNSPRWCSTCLQVCGSHYYPCRSGDNVLLALLVEWLIRGLIAHLAHSLLAPPNTFTSTPDSAVLFEWRKELHRLSITRRVARVLLYIVVCDGTMINTQ